MLPLQAAATARQGLSATRSLLSEQTTPSNRDRTSRSQQRTKQQRIKEQGRASARPILLSGDNMRLAFTILISFLGIAAQAQTLVGVKSECGAGPKHKACRGSFEIRNDSLKPIAFTIDADSVMFNATMQKPVSGRLLAGAQASVSESSGRLSPKETRLIDFKAQCQQLPCVIGFAVGMSGGHTTDGIAIRFMLRHFCYICEKEKNCRVDILKASGVVPPEQRK